MYEYLEQPVDRLDAGSRFVLHAMRVWVDAAQKRLCPPRALLIAMPQEQLRPVIGDLHRTMLVLHFHGTGSMPFGEINDPNIAEGEAVMLSLWKTIVADHADQSRAMLEMLVTEPAIAPMQAAMMRAAACLSAAGLAPAGRLAVQSSR